jgi:hypothetical protein
MERVFPIALLAFFASAIGIALAVIFRWRLERRQNKELRLRVVQLESQMTQQRGDSEKPI